MVSTRKINGNLVCFHSSLFLRLNYDLHSLYEKVKCFEETERLEGPLSNCLFIMSFFNSFFKKDSQWLCYTWKQRFRQGNDLRQIWWTKNRSWPWNLSKSRRSKTIAKGSTKCEARRIYSKRTSKWCNCTKDRHYATVGHQRAGDYVNGVTCWG